MPHFFKSYFYVEFLLFYTAGVAATVAVRVAPVPPVAVAVAAVGTPAPVPVAVRDAGVACAAVGARA